MKNNKLCIFDVNGVFCCKVPKSQPADVKLRSYNIFLRPFYQEFLEFCYNNYKIAFFSSTNRHNVDVILKNILTQDQQKETCFVWCRDRTHFDPDTDSFETIKILDDVFTNPIVNHNRLYSAKNTILVDDSKAKTRYNNDKNVLICEPFTGLVKNQHLYDLMTLIPEKFGQLA